MNPGETVHRQKVAFFDYYDKLDWHVVSSVYTDELLDEVNHLRNIMLVIVIVSLILIILLTVLTSNSIANPLAHSSKDLYQASSSIKSAAGQVSTSGQELASGASELAASVEEMTSSLEELQSIIEANTKVANEGELMARNNHQITVVKGKEMMNKLTVALEEISANSQKIVKIIKVIDDIAFQTNILALNAAVEAARAGEAGKGFAVVADQVKALAQKSAEAAKETADLIEKAVESVKAGQTYGDEVANAAAGSAEMSEKVGTILSEINKASTEQLKGANQVTKAVNQINTVVQQTASSSEELASAGEELLSQAEMLTQVVFNLAEIVQGAQKSEQREASKN